MMNRRSFTARLSLFTLGILIGCGASPTTIAAFVNLIGKYAASLATYFNAGGIATQIISLASQIAIDITNWQSGGAAADAIQAIDDLIGLVNQIPIAAPYAPLIVLILSALTGLLALLPQSAATAKVMARANSKYRFVPNHYADAKNKTMTKAAKDLTSAWQSQLAITPLTK